MIHFGHCFDTQIREALTPHQEGFDAVLTLKAAFAGMYLRRFGARVFASSTTLRHRL
jgi:hypothetical protein